MKIAYCPRNNNTERVVLGVFEGANNADFGDAIPLYLIKLLQKFIIKTITLINYRK